MINELRIFHISDLHFVPLRACTGPTGRYVGHRALSQVFGVPLPNYLIQGTCGHDPKALRALRRSIIEAADDDYWRDKTALVVTGDFSTWGDDASLKAATKFVKVLAKDASLKGPYVVYGNHDVWPGKPANVDGLPVRNNARVLDDNRTVLRKRHFPQDFLEASNFLGVPVLGINTILHEGWPNMLACGEVQDDRYWEGAQRDSQLKELGVELGTHDLAVLLSHHPVYDPTPWPKGHGPFLGRVSIPPALRPLRLHSLANATDVGQSLGVGPQHCNAPVRLVLSGHTHETFPEPGKLPSSAPTRHGDLPHNGLQLTVGTAAQGAAPGRVVAQDWQSLTLSHDRQRKEVTVQRIVFRRNGGSGRFTPISDQTTSKAVAEAITLRM